MSKDVRSIIGDMERNLAKWRMVAKRFPDARSDTLPDGRSVFIAPNPRDWADKATMVADTKGTIFAVPYTIVEEVDGDECATTAYVFGESYHYARADGALARLKLNHPEAYALWEKCLWSESIATRETSW